MFIILLTYKKSLEIVDQWLVPHRNYLDECYKQQLLLVSGPQIPRTGGVLVATVKHRTQVETLIQGDPFFQQEIADYQIIEFTPVKYQPIIEALISRQIH